MEYMYDSYFNVLIYICLFMSFPELFLLIASPSSSLWAVFSCFFVSLVIYDGMLDIKIFTLFCGFKSLFWDVVKSLGISLLLSSLDFKHL